MVPTTPRTGVHAFLLRLWLTALAGVVLVALGGVSAQAAPGPATSPRGSGLIIQNVGQFPDEIRYVVWGGEAPLWLTEDAVYAPEGAGMARITLAHAMGTPQASGRLATTVSFFRGDDPTRWRTHVPVWGMVEYAGSDGTFLRVGADGEIRHRGALAENGVGLAHSDLAFATVIRGSQADQEGSVAVDASGSAYVVGQTRSADFPVSAGAVITGYAGGTHDVFVAKLAADGRSLIYATFLGGGDSDLGKQVAVDAGGNVYVVGDTSSTDFPATAGAMFPTHSGVNSDSFVASLNGDGTQLRFSTFLGGNNYENMAAIALAPDGDLVVTGRTQSADFFVTPDAYDPLHRGGWEVFVTRFAGDGSDVRFSTFLGGNRDDGPADLAVDGDGNIYVGGYTWSSAFPTTPGAFDTTFNGGYTDAFLTKLKADGSGLIYSTLLGSVAGEAVASLAVDPSGHAFITGFTASPGFPTTAGAYDTSPNGGDDAFVAKVLPDGSGLVFSTLLGGSKYDYGRGVALNSAGEVVILGETESPAFPTTPGAVDNQYNGDQDLFVAKLSADGSDLAYATFLGGTASESGRQLAVDTGDHVYVSGHTLSQDFAPNVIGSASPDATSTAQILVVKLTTPTRPNLSTFLPALSR